MILLSKNLISSASAFASLFIGIFTQLLIFFFPVNNEDMPMMRNQLKIRKRLDGNTSMEMYSGIPSTSLYLQLPLVLVPNYLPCK